MMMFIGFFQHDASSRRGYARKRGNKLALKQHLLQAPTPSAPAHAKVLAAIRDARSA
jgi:hypothetical protein